MGEFPCINEFLMQAIRDAEVQGATHVGLGALNKAAILNNNGKDLVQSLWSGCTVKLVSGNTLTAAVVYRSVRSHADPQQEILVTGATSTIGKAVVLRLLQDGCRLRILTKSQQRSKELRDLAGDMGRHLMQIEQYEDGTSCRTWILGAP